MVCDTMNEIDDQFAIAYALGSPKLEVLAVISSTTHWSMGMIL
jgi:inosine-uridine nucleoside N-ribohydrolase